MVRPVEWRVSRSEQALLDDEFADPLDAAVVPEIGEHERPGQAHGGRIPRHDLEGGPHVLGKVHLVDDEQVALHDAWSTLAGILSPAATSMT